MEKSCIPDEGGTIGTTTHMAPEIADFRGNRYDNKVDIWSFGVVLHCMATGSSIIFKDVELEEHIMFKLMGRQEPSITLSNKFLLSKIFWRAVTFFK